MLGSEYNYIRGDLLLRVSGELPPSAAEVYSAAFNGDSLPASGSGSSSPEDASTSPASEAVEPLPFNASGFLGGNFEPKLPPGAPGKIDIVAKAPLDRDQIGGAILAVALRNNTSEAVSTST